MGFIYTERDRKGDKSYHDVQKRIVLCPLLKVSRDRCVTIELQIFFVTLLILSRPLPSVRNRCKTFFTISRQSVTTVLKYLSA
jgi:hypothetical protein